MVATSNTSVLGVVDEGVDFMEIGVFLFEILTHEGKGFIPTQFSFINDGNTYPKNQLKDQNELCRKINVNKPT